MNEIDIPHFKTLLEAQLAELIYHASSTLSILSAYREKFADMNDQATHEDHQNFLLRIGDRERQLARKIQKALDRIQRGRFGICERCEEIISIKWLNARPVATLCIYCKNKEEIRERRIQK